MTTAIARQLNIAEAAVLRCEEWAHVFFVVIKGIGARFVSKRVLKMNQQELAQKVVDALSNKYGFGQLSVWEKKDGEKRVYIKKIGYVCVKEAIDLYWLKSYKKEIESELGDLMTAKCSLSETKSGVTEEGLAAAYGWREVADAQADVAREDWDI